MLTRRNVFGLLALVLVVALAFLWGRAVGRSDTRAWDRLASASLSALNAAGAYVLHTQMAQQIEAGQHDAALCAVQMYAGAKLMEMESCLSDASCRQVVQDELEKLAPELLTEEGRKAGRRVAEQGCPPRQERGKLC